MAYENGFKYLHLPSMKNGRQSGYHRKTYMERPRKPKGVNGNRVDNSTLGKDALEKVRYSATSSS